jgi:hypothetical protein
MMPAGKYYIGDLCYVMADDEWKEICSIIIPIQGNNILNGEFELKDGRKFAIYSTMYGDGVYHDQYGHSYSVDAGCIGCIKLEDIKYVDNYDQFLDLGAILDFDTDFDTGGDRGESDWEGRIQFGHVVIETTLSYEEEE